MKIRTDAATVELESHGARIHVETEACWLRMDLDGGGGFEAEKALHGSLMDRSGKTVRGWGA